MYDRLIWGCILLGFLLLPFSTSAGEGSVVVSFGLPLFSLAAVGIFLKLLLAEARFRRSLLPAVVVAMLVIMMIIISLAFVPRLTASAARAYSQVLGFLLFLYFLSYSVKSPHALQIIYDRVAWWVTLSGTILASYFLINLILATREFGLLNVLTSRAVGGLMSLPWGASNVVAAALIFPFFAALAQFFNHKKWQRIFALGAVTVILAAVFSTQSRNALISIVLGLTILAFVGKRWKTLIGLIVAAFIGASIIYSLNREAIEQVLFRRLDLQVILSLNGRLSIWSDVVQMISDNNLIPFGYYSAIDVLGFSSHNIILNTVLEQSIPGLLLFLALYALAFLYSIEVLIRYKGHPQTYAMVWIAMMATAFINAQFEDASVTAQYAVYFWSTLSLVFLTGSLPEKRILPRKRRGERRVKVMPHELQTA